MKLNDPRITLIAGLALALNLNGSSATFGVERAVREPLLLARAQVNPDPAATPVVPQPGVPSLAPTPLSPVPTPATPPPPPSDGSAVTTSPLPLGTKPTPVPGPRPPMGMLYGEQERLDAKMNPPLRPVPMQPPSGVNGVPAVIDGSGNVGSNLETVPPHIVTDRFGFAPPPGTLGQTYKRRSRILEENKHPRIGVVEVYLPEEVDVTARGLKSKWTGKVWRLESDSLLPGIPHIYEIKASWGEGTQPQVRTVRLIMGRIVDLEF